VATAKFTGDESGNVAQLHGLRVGRRRISRRSPAPSSLSRLTWCCWPWASPPSQERLLGQLGVKLDPRGNVATVTTT